MAVSAPHPLRAQVLLLVVPLLLLAWWAASAKQFLYAPYHALSVFAAEHLGGWAARLFPLALPEGWGPSADSWGAMFQAQAELAASGRPYDVFFGGGVRFQYPPLSLLLVMPFADGGLRGFAGTMNALAVLAHGAVAVLAALLTWNDWRRRNGGPSRGAWAGLMLCAGAAIGTALFPPLLLGTTDGQIQTTLTVAVLLAVIAVQRGRHALAAVIVAGTCVFKPMLAPIALWALLAGLRRAALAFVLAGGVLAGASVLLFGLEAHADYLRVLSYLGRSSERFINNSAPAGLVSRLLSDPETWDLFAFNTPRSWVHATGLATQILFSLVAIGTARFVRHDGPLAFATAIAALTLAPPVIWQYHYSFLLPLALLSLTSLLARPASPRGPGETWRALAWAVGMVLLTTTLYAKRLVRLPPGLAQPASMVPFLGGLCLVWVGWSLLAEARRAEAGAEGQGAAPGAAPRAS